MFDALFMFLHIYIYVAMHVHTVEHKHSISSGKKEQRRGPSTASETTSTNIIVPVHQDLENCLGIDAFGHSLKYCDLCRFESHANQFNHCCHSFCMCCVISSSLSTNPLVWSGTTNHLRLKGWFRAHNAPKAWNEYETPAQLCWFHELSMQGPGQSAK